MGKKQNEESQNEEGVERKGRVKKESRVQGRNKGGLRKENDNNEITKRKMREKKSSLGMVDRGRRRRV